MKISKYTLILLSWLWMPCHLTYSQNLDGDWQIVGPVAFPTNISGQINGIGRVCQMKFHPSDSNKLYAASASGGMWVSLDGGDNWNKTGTDVFPVGTSTASICIDYTNDNILYLGTGDPNYGFRDLGIWKSTNAGATWSPSGTGMGNLIAYEILMDPSDPNVLLAATDDGLWKSTDAGGTWVNKKSGGYFEDMVYKPGSGSVVYAVGYQTTFWRSADNGETWAEIPTVNPTPDNGNGGRLAVSAANPDVVYAAFIGSNSSNAGGIVYRSEDAGLTFTLKKGDTSPNLVGYSATSSGQGDYNFTFEADRTNPDIVYLGAHNVWKSTDGGSTWSQLTNWWEKCHTDMHHMLTSPYNNNKLFNANDGGIFLSTDGGNNWIPKSDGLSATEIYKMGTSKLNRNIISIGTQDNGELYGDGTTWFTNRGGDVLSNFDFDYARPHDAYFVQDGVRYDLVANGSGQSIGLTGFGNTDQYAFSASNTDLMFASTGGSIKRTVNLQNASPTWKTLKKFPQNQQIMDIGLSPVSDDELILVTDAQKVYLTTNAQANKPSFNQVSTAPSATNNYANIVMVKSNPNIVYMSCGNRVYKSTNKGSSWSDISGSLPLVNIKDMIQDEYGTDESVYIGTAEGVYYLNNTLPDWVYFSDGLPSIAEVDQLTIFNDGTSNSALRVGTWGRGVWESSLYDATSSYTLPSMSSSLLKEEFGDDPSENVLLYPNPAKNQVQISIKATEKTLALVQLTDIHGRIVQWTRRQVQLGANDIPIDISTLTTGNYFILVKMGETTVSKKLIVAH